MKSIYPRLYRRNHAYYIRVFIPRKIQSLVKKKEIKYSLKTNDYYEALCVSRWESYRIDIFLQRLKMKVEAGQLFLTQDDLDVIQLGRLKEIERERRMTIFGYNGVFDPNEASLFSHSNLDSWIKEEVDIRENTQITDTTFKLDMVKKWFFSYVEKESGNDEHSQEIRDLLKEIVEKKIEVPLMTKESFSTMALLLRKISPLEQYAVDKVKAKEERREFYVDEDIKILLEIINNEQKKQKENSKLGIVREKTTWIQCWEESKKQKFANGSRERSVSGEENRLKRIFKVIDKKYVEDFDLLNCRKVEMEVKTFKNGIGKNIADKTIKEYLVSFKALLKFAKNKMRIIKDDFNEVIEIQKKIKERERRAFKEDELIKLFNFPEYLKYRYTKDYFYRFWLPIIALYTGARLHEICQLEVNDIKEKDGIWCFHFTEEGEGDKKRLKTEPSKRFVPIHKNLIQIGFLDFYEKVRKNPTARKRWFDKNNTKIELTDKNQKKNKADNLNPENLFFTLTYTKGNGFAGAMSNWFSRKKRSLLGNIKNERVDFHSFRHTFTTELKKNGTPRDEVNGICGWENKEQSDSYSHHLNVVDMKKNVDKVSYPSIEKDLSKLMPDPEKEKIFL